MANKLPQIKSLVHPINAQLTNMKRTVYAFQTTAVGKLNLQKLMEHVDNVQMDNRRQKIIRNVRKHVLITNIKKMANAFQTIALRKHKF